MAHTALKFRSSSVEDIKGGESNITWRLFDDKDIQAGDTIDLIEADTDKKFAEAQVLSVSEKPFAEIDDEDFDGTEHFDSPEEMYETYQSFYEEPVGPDTIVKVIHFDVLPMIGNDEEDMDEDEDLEEELSDDE